MKIIFGGHELILHPSGCLFWPEESLLVVSDLHLEKGSHHAKRGFFLPPYDTHKTLTRLHEVCKQTGCANILLLGDCFHDVKGYSRLSNQDRALFNELLPLNPIWIYGNHDGEFVPDGFKAMEVYDHCGLIFRHIALQEDGCEISGHYHPKAEITQTYMTKPCFVTDGRKLILPAFGSYTGGLSVNDPAIQELFQTTPQLYVLGMEKVYRI